jgi:hypothetical protein
VIHKERVMNLRPTPLDDMGVDIISHDVDLRLREWVASELRERKTRFDARPESGMTWDEVARGLDEPT